MSPFKVSLVQLISNLHAMATSSYGPDVGTAHTLLVRSGVPGASRCQPHEVTSPLVEMAEKKEALLRARSEQDWPPHVHRDSAIMVAQANILRSGDDEERQMIVNAMVDLACVINSSVPHQNQKRLYSHLYLVGFNMADKPCVTPILTDVVVTSPVSFQEAAPLLHLGDLTYPSGAYPDHVTWGWEQSHSWVQLLSRLLGHSLRHPTPAEIAVYHGMSRAMDVREVIAAHGIDHFKSNYGKPGGYMNVIAIDKADGCRADSGYKTPETLLALAEEGQYLVSAWDLSRQLTVPDIVEIAQEHNVAGIIPIPNPSHVRFDPSAAVMMPANSSAGAQFRLVSEVDL